jgi:hypothetical protein
MEVAFSCDCSGRSLLPSGPRSAGGRKRYTTGRGLTLDNPTDTAILGKAIMDEVCNRLLTGERGSDLRVVLQQRGQIQLVSKAAEHIHQNVGKLVSVDALAEMVHMSRLTFFDSCKALKDISLLQYAKSVKLDRAARSSRRAGRPAKPRIWSATTARPSSAGSASGTLVSRRRQRRRPCASVTSSIGRDQGRFSSLCRLERPASPPMRDCAGADGRQEESYRS